MDGSGGIERHRGLIYLVAHQYARRCRDRAIEADDLAQAAMIALWLAGRRGDQGGIGPIIHFAMRNCISKGCGLTSWGQRLASKVAKYRDAHYAEHGRDPSDEEIMAGLDISEKVLAAARAAMRFQAPGPLYGEDGEPLPIADPGESALEQVAAAERDTMIHEAVRELPKRERTVIELHYFERLTHREIGARIQRSIPAVEVRCRAGRAAIREALERLRDRRPGRPWPPRVT